MLQEPKPEIIDEIYKNKSPKSVNKMNLSEISKNSKKKIEEEHNSKSDKNVIVQIYNQSPIPNPHSLNHLKIINILINKKLV